MTTTGTPSITGYSDIASRPQLLEQRWTLGFYDFGRTWARVDDLVPGFGDVRERARRNGAVADYIVNAFWRAPWPGAMGLKAGTVRRYAYSLKVWLDFLHAVGARWELAGREELSAFKRWRLSVEENPDRVCTPRR
jgi:hypothetical protein